jgi:hypothetical protein
MIANLEVERRVGFGQGVGVDWMVLSHRILSFKLSDAITHAPNGVAFRS